MDEHTPHRRRRQRADSYVPAAQQPSAARDSNRSRSTGAPASPGASSFSGHVAQTERSRPQSAPAAAQNTAARTTRRPVSQTSGTSIAGDGVTRVYRVSDEPVRQTAPRSCVAPEQSTYYFTPGDYPNDENRRAERTTAQERPLTRTSSGVHDAAAQRKAAQSGTQSASAPRTASSGSRSSASRQNPPRLVQGYRPDPQPTRRRSSSSGSNSGMPPRRRKKGLPAFVKVLVALILVVGVFAGIYMGGTYLVNVKNTLSMGDGVFYPNLYINNISLGGMTKDEALTAVGTQVQQQMDAFSITIASTTGQSWTINKDTLSMRYDVEERVNELWRVGHEGNASQRYEQVTELLVTPIQRYTALTYDITGLNTILTQIKSDVDRNPVNATRISDNTVFPPFSYTNDQVGYSLDISAAYTQICDMIDRLESGTVTLTPTVIEPTVTKAQLQSQITQIGYYETKINTSKSNEGRTMNVTMGCQKFNHMTVANGARVSFNDVTGKRSEKNGWYPALEIAYGEYTTGYGGGICQVSSTLYNACISAGLEIVRRSQHGLEVGYIEKGLDATVSNEGPDFIFRNNTGAEIYIAAGVETRGNAKYCVFIIYGRPDPNNYTRYLEGRIVEELPIPEASIKEDKDENGDGVGDTYGLIYQDETKVVSDGRVGCKVDTYLITKDSDGNVVSEEYRYTDTFKAIAPVWYVGTHSRD